MIDRPKHRFNKKSNVRKNNTVSLQQMLTQLFSAHSTALKLSFRNLAQSPFTTFMTILAIGIALSLPLGLHALLKNIQDVASGFEYQGSLTLYLDAKIPEPEIYALQSKIKSEFPEVLNTKYISADTALAEFRQQVDIENVLALLPQNPLTGMIVVQINSEDTPYKKTVQLKNTFADYPWVKMVDLDYEWVEKLQAFLHLGQVLSNCLGLLIGLGVMFIIGNIIRLSLEKHKDELEVLNLLGATRSFIRRPFLYRGFCYSVLGAIVAALIITLATWMMRKPAQTLTHLYDGAFAIQSLSLTEIFSLCFYSCLLGWLGSWLAFYQQQKALS